MTGDELIQKLTAMRSDRFAEARSEAEAHAAEHGCGEQVASLAEARLLDVLVKATRASYVLHVGGGLGYANLHIAGAFGHTGQLDATNRDERHAELAERLATRYALGDRIRIHRGDTREVVGSLNGPFDVIVLGSAWADYPALAEDFARLVRVGGTIVVRNGGRFADALADEDESRETAGLRELLERLATDERFALTVAPGFSLVLAARVR